jgi:hypothetical protein
VLESFTGRLLEEDSWSERVMLERAIGDLVVGVCRGDVPESTSGPVKAIGPKRRWSSLTTPYQEMMFSLTV